MPFHKINACLDTILDLYVINAILSKHDIREDVIIMKIHNDSFDEELISFLENKYYLDESESIDLLLMTYYSKPDELINLKESQPVDSGQSVQFIGNRAEYYN